LRILIVDDERSVRITLDLFFRRAGHNVKVAANGDEAYRVALEFVPDVVLSDIDMPVQDGLELLSALKEAPLTCLVVLMSADAKRYAEASIQLGATAFFAKPVLGPRLVSEITALMAVL
jgi:CheY-like chemotaxis protein